MALDPDKLLDRMMYEFPADWSLGMNSDLPRSIYIVKKNKQPSDPRVVNYGAPDFVPKWQPLHTMLYSDFLIICQTSGTMEQGLHRTIALLTTGQDPVTNGLTPQLQKVVEEQVAGAAGRIRDDVIEQLRKQGRLVDMPARTEMLPKTGPLELGEKPTSVARLGKTAAKAAAKKAEMQALIAYAESIGEKPVLSKAGHVTGAWCKQMRQRMQAEVVDP